MKRSDKPNDSAAITIAEIAAGTGLCDKTVRKAIRGLIEKGLFEVEYRPGKPSIFAPVLDEDALRKAYERYTGKKIPC